MTSFIPDFLLEPFWLKIFAVVSLFSFIASLVIIPWLIIRLPDDYFIRDRESGRQPGVISMIVHYMIQGVKNAFGILLICLGLVMLVLPGQGILTMLIGLSLVDFPGKHRVEQYLVQRPSVLKSLNWIRMKANKPPLRVHG